MDQPEKKELARSLRERDLLLLFVGSVIGSGIFLTPGLIQRQVGGSVGYALLVWLVGGVLSLLGALTYAELSAANPEAGGLYCYIRDAFGRLPAFLYGWGLFLVIASATIAALAHAFGYHQTRFLKALAVFVGCHGDGGFRQALLVSFPARSSFRPTSSTCRRRYSATSATSCNSTTRSPDAAL